jgi:hypothetical protein
MLLLATAVAYFGVNVGEVYVRAYRYEDALANQVRFARQNTDDEIRRYMRALADSLGLPEEAAQLKIRRTASRIDVSAEYAETIELPGFVRSVRFTPSASSGL